MNITFNPLYSNNNYNFGSKYTPAEICADLCKGACCNHGTPMSATLKRIADKFNASYHSLPDDLKTSAIIKTPILKWIVDSSDIDLQRVNDMANIYIDAISREKNPENIKQLSKSLRQLNEKLEQMLGDEESFLTITRSQFLQNPQAVVFSNSVNPCAFKDHGKTNKCSIYGGITTSEGEFVDRPKPCYSVGSSELPCPWLNPEKLDEVVKKTRQNFAKVGYRNIPDNVLNDYIAKQFNLNEIWLEKIYKPFLKSEH